MASSSPSLPSSSTVMIQHLPELSLLSLFHSLPLHYLLHIDEVCSDWGKLKLEALRQRKELVIVEEKYFLDKFEWPNNGLFWNPFDKLIDLVKNEDGSPYIKRKVGLDNHTLFVNSITCGIADQITRLMPKLKALRIYYYYLNRKELEQINRLLTFYRHQLVEVNICFQGEIRSSETLLKSLFLILKSMTALKILNLDLNPLHSEYLISADLSVLSRLEIVILKGIEETCFFNQLKQYAEGNERLKILIGFISPSHRIFELLNMNLLFPNVQVADLKVCYPKLCTDCYADQEPSLVQNDPEQKKIYYRQAHTCVRLAHSSKP
ncbi:hypothetical protein TYRP_013470 [Tyrophagus putrescentiae]|nr:hypothetical protein TYRP_013470 [Tyrophagus putrescentiae]